VSASQVVKAIKQSVARSVPQQSLLRFQTAQYLSIDAQPARLGLKPQKRLKRDITGEPNARILRAVLEGRNSGAASGIELY
jgi:hypothetical protein